MRSEILLLRGAIVNRTCGIHKNLPGTYLTISTNNILVLLTMVPRNTTPKKLDFDRNEKVLPIEDTPGIYITRTICPKSVIAMEVHERVWVKKPVQCSFFFFFF